MFTGLFISTFTLALDASVEKASIDWNIAATAGIQGPNVLSELTFDPIDSANISLGFGYLSRIGEHFAIGFSGRFEGDWILDGEVKDSDFLSNDRADEYSRSKAEIDGDKRRRTELQVDTKTRWFGVTGHYVSLGLGFDSLSYDLALTNGYQIIPDTGAFEGLNSKYSPKFSGPFATLTTEHLIGPVFVSVAYRYQWTDLDSEATWNLRSDFAQPKSFVHKGEGTSQSISLEVLYPALDRLDLFAKYHIDKTSIESGYDQIFFSNGDSFVTKLNEVNHEGQSLHLGMKYHF